MALTWRDVAAPDFSGAIQAQRASAEAMNNGFAALSNAIAGYQQGQLAQVQSDDAHRRSLLGDESVRLANAALAERNGQEAWANQNARAYEAARPAAVARTNEIRSLLAQGTPEAKAQADKLMSESSNIWSAAGWSPDSVNAMITGNMTTSVQGLGVKDAFQAASDKQLNRDNAKQVTDLLNSTINGSADRPAAATLEDAKLEIQNRSDLPANIRMATLAALEKNAPLFGGAVDPNDVIADQQNSMMQRIQYQNQNSTRNDPLSEDLVKAIAPALEKHNVTMRVFSGGQESADEVKAGKGNRTGSIRHDHGGAGDVEFYAKDGHKLDPRNPDDLKVLTSIVQDGVANGILGWGEGDDYMGAGRIHLGFGNPGIWGKDGKSENAPQWLRDAWNNAKRGEAPSDPLAVAIEQANQASNTAAQDNQNMASTFIKSAATQSKDLLNRTDYLEKQAVMINDQAAASKIYERDAALVDTLVNRPDRQLDDNAVIDKLYKEMGDTDGLTRDQMADEVRMVMDQYKFPADVAAAYIKNAGDQTTWGFRWAAGNRSVYQSRIADQVKRFGDPKNIEGTVARIQALRVDQEIAQAVKVQSGRLKKAQDDYFAAARRKNSGFNVDVDAKRRKYEQVQQEFQKVLDMAKKDPRRNIEVTSNTGL